MKRVATLLVIAFGLILLAASAAPAAPATRAQMLAAANSVVAAQALLIEEKRGRGLWPGAKIDPNATGMIGQEYTAMTTTAATLANKRTATDPDFAAALVKRVAAMGVTKGDKVLVIESGSFLGADIAILAALETLQADIILIPSLGASQWGANDPEFNLMDILALLLARGVLHTHPLAVVLGGSSGTGLNMEPGMPDFLRKSLVRHDVRLVDDPVLETIVDRLTVLIDAAAGGRQNLKLMVKVGGSVISTGNCPENLKYETDIRPQTVGCSGTTPGLLYLPGTQQVPILHLLNMMALAEQMGLPYDPVPLPQPGANLELYGAP
jgi:poly-gamma-glutamate system protein